MPDYAAPYRKPRRNDGVLRHNVTATEEFVRILRPLTHGCMGAPHVETDEATYQRYVGYDRLVVRVHRA